MTEDPDVQAVCAYHTRTMHRPWQYADGPGYLDWANQPDPFRTYEPAPRVFLPRERDAVIAEVSMESLERAEVAPELRSLRSISMLFFHSLAISAWKQHHETRWALRCNPSSGNLHPTECYVIAPAIEGLSDTAGVHHYRPREHALEQRAVLHSDVWKALARDLHTPEDTALVLGLSSVHWRESWKYGERAFRYCQHDVGHALSAIRYAAGLLGWTARMVHTASDKTVATLLGIDRVDDRAEAEEEHPDVLIVVQTNGTPITHPNEGLSNETVRSFQTAQWSGRANTLSSEHVEWEQIPIVAHASHKREHAVACGSVPFHEPWIPRGRSPNEKSAAQLMRTRRSATDFDKRQRVSRATLFGMLDRTLPRSSAPLDILASRVSVHLAVIVHNVDDVPRGLYMLVRDHEALPALRENLAREFDWVQLPDAPETLPLYRLAEADLRAIGREISCGQNIAGDCAFTVGMIAEFRSTLEKRGAWAYRESFWETGAIGQVLYVEAEAAGIRGTGIGCFFDPLVHDLLGITDDQYRSLYHFAVGHPVDDLRMSTLPAYGE